MRASVYARSSNGPTKQPAKRKSIVTGSMLVLSNTSGAGATTSKLNTFLLARTYKDLIYTSNSTSLLVDRFYGNLNRKRTHTHMFTPCTLYYIYLYTSIHWFYLYDISVIWSLHFPPFPQTLTPPAVLLPGHRCGRAAALQLLHLPGVFPPTRWTQQARGT